MKPHRSIFDAALRDAGVEAGEALMVGDSLHADVARRPGRRPARGVAAPRRRRCRPTGPAHVPVIRRLHELPSIIWPATAR